MFAIRLVSSVAFITVLLHLIHLVKKIRFGRVWETGATTVIFGELNSHPSMSMNGSKVVFKFTFYQWLCVEGSCYGIIKYIVKTLYFCGRQQWGPTGFFLNVNKVAITRVSQSYSVNIFGVVHRSNWIGYLRFLIGAWRNNSPAFVRIKPWLIWHKSQ